MASADPPLVFLFQHVGRMQIEVRRRAAVVTAEFRVAAVAYGDVAEPAVDYQIDQRRRGQNAVRDQIAAEPVEARADRSADDDHGETHFRVEVFSQIEISTAAHRARVHGGVRHKFGTEA